MPARVFRYLVPSGVVSAQIRVTDGQIDGRIHPNRSCTLGDSFQLTVDQVRALCPPAGSAMLSFGWHEHHRCSNARWFDLAASAAASGATIPHHIQLDLKDAFPLRVLVPCAGIASMHECWVMVFAELVGSQITANVEVENVSGPLMSARLLDALSQTRRPVDCPIYQKGTHR
jgi:hypothetical protein